jgi:hypothetical protein
METSFTVNAAATSHETDMSDAQLADSDLTDLPDDLIPIDQLLRDIADLPGSPEPSEGLIKNTLERCYASTGYPSPQYADQLPKR